MSGFVGVTGGNLLLASGLNRARVLKFGARLLCVDHVEFTRLALSDRPGAVMLPYLDGERTPNRPQATGVLHGLTSATNREDLSRAVVEGLLCSLQDAVNALEAATGPTQRIMLIGGGAQSQALHRIARQVFWVGASVSATGEYVALGAAQAAWALSGSEEPQAWPGHRLHGLEDTPRPHDNEHYAELRDRTETWA